MVLGLLLAFFVRRQEVWFLVDEKSKRLLVTAHRAHAEASGVLAERRAFRSREELREIVTNRLRERAREICTGERWEQLTDEVAAQTTDPWTAADEMLV